MSACENGRVCARTVGYVQRRGGLYRDTRRVPCSVRRRCRVPPARCVQRPRPDEYRLRDEKRSAQINFRGQSVHAVRTISSYIDRCSLYTNTHDREINAERRHAVRVLLLAQKTDTTHDASSEHTHPHTARFIRHHTPQSHKTVTTYASTYASLSRSVARRRRAAPLEAHSSETSSSLSPSA